jgi:hypothetical protein
MSALSWKTVLLKLHDSESKRSYGNLHASDLFPGFAVTKAVGDIPAEVERVVKE